MHKIIPSIVLAYAAALVMPLLLSGCTSLLAPGDAEPAKLYLLEIATPRPPKADPQGPSLLVSRPQAAAGFTGSDMIYVETAHRLDRFLRHRWTDTPARMLEPLLIETLEASGLYRSVAAPGTPVATDLRLDTELLRLAQVFTPAESVVEVALRITLVDVERSTLIASSVLNVSEPASERSPYAGVEAANRALGRLLEELNELLESSLAGPQQ
jgi:cholesterol transport system auxiliary component